MKELIYFTICVILANILLVIIVKIIFKKSILQRISIVLQGSASLIAYCSFVLGAFGFIHAFWAVPAAVITMSAAYYFIYINIKQPLKIFTDHLKEAENGVINQSISNKLYAEFEEFKDNLNSLFNKFKETLVSINLISTQNINSSNDLSVASNQLSASIVEIAANIKNINTNILNLNEKYNQMNSSSEKINTSLIDIESFTNNQAAQTTESTASINEIAQEINSINKNIEMKLEKIKKINELSKLGNNEMNNTSKNIETVFQSTDTIVNITKVIESVASQTNLLAMNASIEAAHAGESGKGFAVVAEEIRKLADETNKNSNVISKSLKSMVDDIQRSKQSIIQTKKYFDDIIIEIEDITTGMTEIKYGTQELNNGSESILKAASILQGTNTKVQDSVNNNKTIITSIIDDIKMLGNLSEETKNSSNEIENGISELNKASVTILDTSSKNKESTEKLNSLISFFKVT